LQKQGQRYDQALQDLIAQINSYLKKNDENVALARRDVNHMQEEFGKISSHF
jgi:hypothetical protein